MFYNSNYAQMQLVKIIGVSNLNQREDVKH